LLRWQGENEISSRYCGRSPKLQVAIWVRMARLVMVMWWRLWWIAPSLFNALSALVICLVVGVLAVREESDALWFLLLGNCWAHSVV
jgi:hypothetical protein